MSFLLLFSRRPWQGSVYLRTGYSTPSDPQLFDPDAAGGYAQSVGGSVASNGTIIKTTNRGIVGGVSPVGVVTKFVTRLLVGALTPTRTLIRQVGRALSGAVASTGEVTALRIVFQTLTASLTPAGTLVKSTARSLTGALTPLGIVSRFVSRLVTGTVTPLGARRRLLVRGLTGTVASSGAVGYASIFLRTLTSTVTPAGRITRQIARSVTGAVAPAGIIRRSIARLVSGVLTPSGMSTGVRLTTTQCRLYLNRVDRTAYLHNLSDEVEDILNAEPNQYRLTMRRLPALSSSPLTIAEGMEIVLARGPSQNVEFAGNILTIDESREELPGNIVYTITAQDFTWLLNRRRITKRWTNTSATTIATQILSGFTTGFTGNNIAAGLPTITEFECIRERPADALARLAAEFGGNFYVDYGNPLTGVAPDVHLFTTEVTSAPDDLLDTTAFELDIRHSGDLAQVRTRILATGGGTTTAEDTPITATSTPLVDATMFEEGGGSFASGANIGAYTGRHTGGLGATISGNISSPGGSAPTASLATNVVGNLTGTKQYKVSFGDGKGETLAGATSNAVVCAAFSAPTAAVVAATSSVIGRLIGSYLYVVTYVTNLGETTAGTQFGRTATALSAPSAPSISQGGTIGKLIGTYNYKVTYVTDWGETEASSYSTRTASARAIPNAPTVSKNASMGVLIGTYGYRVTFVGADGIETESSSTGQRTAAVTDGPPVPTCTATAIGPLKGTYYYRVSYVGPDGKESCATVSSSAFTHNGSKATTPDAYGTVGGGYHGRARVAWRHPIFGESEWSDPDTYDAVAPVYISPTSIPSGCTWIGFWTGPYTAGGEASAGYYRGGEYGTTSATNVSDSVGMQTTQAGNTMGGNCILSNISTGPSGTVARRIYRTKNGAASSGPFYLVGEINNNTATTYEDLVPDQALTQAMPTQNLNGESHTITFQTGPTGTLKRRIYRTEANGSTFYLLEEIGDNVTTSYTDNKRDESLMRGVQVPVFGGSTMGDQHVLTIPIGPTGVRKRRVYRTDANGSTYKLLVEINDNATSTYTDNAKDTELTAVTAPSTSTAGGEWHTLSAIPLGPTGTLGRRIYRTPANMAGTFKFVGELGNNSTTTFTDTVADDDLGNYVPLVNTAGANQVDLSGIPLGGTGVTERYIYRLATDGSYKFVDTIPDNATTTYRDNVPDESLGRTELAVSTIGASVGDTSLVLNNATGWPTAGWLEADSQLLRWTGLSGNTLTGIPGRKTVSSITRSSTTVTVTTSGAHGYTTGDIVTIQGATQNQYNGRYTITVTGTTTFTYTIATTPVSPATGTIVCIGLGGIVNPIQGGISVVSAPFVSGLSGITYAMERGAEFRLYLVVNDTTAQTALAALEGGDGIHEAPIDDSSIMTVAGLSAASTAELTNYKTKLRSLHFVSRDTKLRSGKTITVNLSSSPNLVGSFLIQRVVSTEFNINDRTNPKRDVTAAPILLSFRDVLRQKGLR